jgi:hypothetical protein
MFTTCGVCARLVHGSERRAASALCAVMICSCARRVEEEEWYARETGYLQNGRFHQNTGYLPALSHAHASETLRRAKTGADGARLEPGRDHPPQRSRPEPAT